MSDVRSRRGRRRTSEAGRRSRDRAGSDAPAAHCARRVDRPASALGIEPILVGRLALELYTDGGYSTGDVDLALAHTPEVDEAFADLGFEKRGRFWMRSELDLLFEAPAPAGLPGETAPRLVLDVDGLRIVVLGVGDLLVARLRAWVHRKSDEDRRWAVRLVELHRAKLDWSYLRGIVAGDAAESSALASLE